MVKRQRNRNRMARLLVPAVAGAAVVAAIVVATLFGTGAVLRDSGPATLRVALANFGAEVLDPSLDSQAGLQYHGHMYDHFLGATPDGKASALLGVLDRWETSPNAGEYTLTLNEGMKWHDGQEVTSGDMEFSLAHYSRLAAACVTCGYVSEAVRAVRPIDRLSVRVELTEPDFTFIERLGPVQEDVPLLPKHRWDWGGQEGLNEAPIGSGPWKFVRRARGESIEYEANLDYWNADRVPGFDRLRLIQVPEEATRVALLQTGAVDMAPVGVDDIASLKRDGFAIQGPRNVITTTLRFFMTYDPAYLTSRLEFRKALALGMDLRSIVDDLYPPEAATLASGSAMFGPMVDGYDPDLPPYAFDPELARDLLRQAGYNGETVHFLSIPAYDLKKMPRFNEMIAEDWREIGLDVRIIPTDYAPVKARYYARPQRFEDLLPAPVFGGGHVNRPGGIVNAISRYLTRSDDGLVAYHDPDKGERIFAEIQAMPNGEERTARLRQLNRELYDEYWAAPLFWRHEIYGLSPNLAGWAPTDGTPADLRFETVTKAR